MADEGQLLRLTARSSRSEAKELAELLDPQALEERLRDARARRAEALAKRAAAGGERVWDPRLGTPGRPAAPAPDVAPPAGGRVPAPTATPTVEVPSASADASDLSWHDPFADEAAPTRGSSAPASVPATDAAPRQPSTETYDRPWHDPFAAEAAPVPASSAPASVPVAEAAPRGPSPETFGRPWHNPFDPTAAPPRASERPAEARRVPPATTPRAEIEPAPAPTLPAPQPEEPAPLRAEPRHPAPAARRSAPGYAILLFLAGLGLGGAAVAVLALRSLPDRLFEPAEVATAPVTPPADAPASDRVATAPVTPSPAPESPASAPVAVAEAPAAPEAGPAGSLREAAPPTPALAFPRPDRPETPPEPSAEEMARAESLPATLAPGAAPAPEATAAAAVAAMPPKVYIHYPGSAEAAAIATRDALLGAGVGEVDILPVRFAISRSNIRYYHDADRGSAEAMTGLLAPLLASAPETRDFTDYPTPAAPGRLELWLAGDSVAASSAPAAPRAAAVRPEPPAPVPAPVPVAPRTPAPGTVTLPSTLPSVALPSAPQAPNQAQAVERILIERLSGR